MIKERIITIIAFATMFLFVASVTYGEYQLKKQLSEEDTVTEAKRVYCLKSYAASSPYCWSPKDWDAYCSKVLCKGPE